MKQDIRDISNAFIIISDVPHTSIPQQTVTIKPLMGNAVEDSSVLIIPIVRKPNHLLLRTFLGAYFQMMYLNINLNINKYMYIMIRQTF